MLGWSIRASACRSASNRATTPALSIPARISLTATRRLTGSCCWAIQTVPIPPSPSTSTSLYRPATTAPGRSAAPLGGHTRRSGRRRSERPGRRSSGRRPRRGVFEEAAGEEVVLGQPAQPLPQLGVAGTGPVQEGRPLLRVGYLHGRGQDALGALGVTGHGLASGWAGGVSTPSADSAGGGAHRFREKSRTGQRPPSWPNSQDRA